MLAYSTDEVGQMMSYFFNFTPKKYQLMFATDCLNEERVIGVWCRQTGKSETVSKVAILLAMFPKKGDVIIFAPTDRQTGLLSQKIMDSIQQMPTDSKMKCTSMTKRQFRFNNGRSVLCETTGPKGETIRGHTAGDIILEEAGTIKDSIIQSCILPMGATTGAKIIKIGTPRGKNHFFESYASGQYRVHRYDYSYGVKENLIAQSFIDEMRITLSDINFRTEMCAEFIEDQDAFFSYELIESCKDKSLSYMTYIKMPMKRYYLGCDIARMGQDSTCLTVVEVDGDNNSKVVQIVEMQKQKLDVVILRISELHEYYDFNRIFIDETGLGAGVTDVLAKKYNVLKILEGQAVKGFPNNPKYGDKIVGVKFTIKTKLDMYSNLKTLMSQQKIRYPAHDKLIAQLRDFRYELTENQNVKLHHSEYGFDDFTDSLCLAVKEVNVTSPVLIF